LKGLYIECLKILDEDVVSKLL